MIPIRDVIPSRTTPYVTIALIVLNVLVFLLMPPGDSAAFDQFIRTWGVTPADVRLVGGRDRDVRARRLRPPVSATCCSCGSSATTSRTAWATAGTCSSTCFAALAAALLQLVVEAGSAVPMVGASGAIAGVLGAYLVLFPQSRVLTLVFIVFVEVPAALLLGLWFATQLLSGLGALAIVRPEDMGGVAFWAHAGGFAAGAALVLLFRRPERMRVEWWDQVAAGSGSQDTTRPADRRTGETALLRSWRS